MGSSSCTKLMALVSKTMRMSSLNIPPIQLVPLPSLAHSQPRRATSPGLTCRPAPSSLHWNSAPCAVAPGLLSRLLLLLISGTCTLLLFTTNSFQGATAYAILSGLKQQVPCVGLAAQGDRSHCQQPTPSPPATHKASGLRAWEPAP